VCPAGGAPEEIVYHFGRDRSNAVRHPLPTRPCAGARRPVTDGLRAEREQGITIDVAYTHVRRPVEEAFDPMSLTALLEDRGLP
jgi:hypothetical protein